MSPVIATVLLLILTIVAVSILAVFIIPFVKDSLGGSKGCFDVLGDIRFDSESRYACSYGNATGNMTGFSVRVDSEEIIGFSLTLFKQGSANSYRIENGTTAPNVVGSIRMLDENFNEPITVPTSGGLRTYVAKGIFERAEINPILRSGKQCNAQEAITFETCTDRTAIDALFRY